MLIRSRSFKMAKFWSCYIINSYYNVNPCTFHQNLHIYVLFRYHCSLIAAPPDPQIYSFVHLFNHSSQYLFELIPNFYLFQTHKMKLILLFGSFMPICMCADILMATLGGTKSHKIPFWELAKGLIPR